MAMKIIIMDEFCKESALEFWIDEELVRKLELALRRSLLSQVQEGGSKPSCMRLTSVGAVHTRGN